MNPPATSPWGEWWGITLAGTLAITTLIQSIMYTLSGIWFGDTTHLLAPFAIIWFVLVIAALVMRLALRQRSDVTMGALIIYITGSLVTGLVMVKTLVFPNATDAGWLGSFANLTDLAHEQPHAELGLLVLAFILWAIGFNLTRFATDSERRKRQFIVQLVVFLSMVALGALTLPSKELARSAIVLMPVYLLAGLIMLSVVQLAVVRERMSQRAVKGARRSWRATTLTLLGVSTSLLVAFGLIIDTAGYANLIAGIRAGLGAVDALLANLLVLLATPIASLVALVFGFVPTPGGKVKVVPTPCLTIPSGSGTPVPQQCAGQSPPLDYQIPLNTQTVNTVSVLILIAALALGFIVLILYLRQRTAVVAETAAYDEVATTVGDTPRNQAAQVQRGSQDDHPPLPRTVRAIFRAFLKDADRAGFGRRRHETVRDYIGRLAQSGQDDTALTPLAKLYQEERYGGTQADDQRTATAQTLVDRLIARWHR